VANTKLDRVVKLLSRVTVSILVFLSTGVATLIFDQFLATETSPTSEWSPEFIFVLGGGYELGANAAQDFLGTESIRRVNAASAIWQKYPESIVVFSGKQPGTEDDRKSTRHGALSSGHAMSLGLAKTRILVESTSSTTNAHPIEALRLSE
ncbi:MAG: YdcF family protein, partial [Acidimicrobiaceae bacterium]